jgi:hypothetical protein
MAINIARRVIPVANPARHRQRQHAFVYDSDPRLSFASNRSQSRLPSTASVAMKLPFGVKPGRFFMRSTI